MKKYLCKELGGAEFIIEATDWQDAEDGASMYGAVVIKEIN